MLSGSGSFCTRRTEHAADNGLYRGKSSCSGQIPHMCRCMKLRLLRLHGVQDVSAMHQPFIHSRSNQLATQHQRRNKAKPHVAFASHGEMRRPNSPPAHSPAPPHSEELAAGSL